MYSDMETQIHILEQEAYGAVLRALKAQSDALTWDKEELITNLRRELRVSDDEHREVLSKVNSDALLRRIREWRKIGGGVGAAPNLSQPEQLQSPTISASRKRQKASHSVPFGTQSQTLHPLPLVAPVQPSSFSSRWEPASGIVSRRPERPVLSSAPMQYQHANHGPGPFLSNERAQRAFDPLIGRKVMTRWPEDSNFYEAVITEYNPVEGRHALVYDINTANETMEWVDLKEFPPEDIRWIGDELGIPGRPESDGQVIERSTLTAARVQPPLRNQVENETRHSRNGFVSKVGDEIEILHTDTLIEKVERVLSVNHPDLLELEKAKKMLKDHEQALIDVISKIAEVCDETEQQYIHTQSVGGRNELRSIQGGNRNGLNIASEIRAG